MDCGPSCLRMIAKYYGRNYSLQTLRARSFITREGVSMLGISDAAESILSKDTSLHGLSGMCLEFILTQLSLDNK